MNNFLRRVRQTIHYFALLNAYESSAAMLQNSGKERDLSGISFLIRVMLNCCSSNSLENVLITVFNASSFIEAWTLVD
jgi:hypothetical protein